MTLDDDEKEIQSAYEAGKITTRVPSRTDRAHVALAALNTMKKTRRITVRLYEHDFTGIQKRAFELGLPYQTLISSLIHRYVDGDLISKP